MPKRSIRERMRSRRRMLSIAEMERAGSDAAQRLLSLPILRDQQTIALYRAIDNELSPDPLIGRLRSMGKRLCFPVVAGDRLIFRGGEHLDRFVTGPFGIPEPDPASRAVPLEEIDLFLLPGVAFDHLGHRVGFGGGFYDRTMAARRTRSILVGYCYDFQLMNEVPFFDHDIVIDIVVTEHRVIFTPCD